LIKFMFLNQTIRALRTHMDILNDVKRLLKSFRGHWQGKCS
jgi:hypothetical protein